MSIMNGINKDEIANFFENNCLNYDKILNFVSTDDDLVTESLIDFYRNSLSKINIKNQAHIRFINELDNIMYLYINDSNLVDLIREIMLNNESFINNNQITDSLFMEVRKAVKEYSDTKFKTVENPIWI